MAGGKVSGHYVIVDVQSLEANGDNLQVRLVSADAIERTSTGLRIKSAGITNAHLAGSIAFAKLADYENIARLDQNEVIAGKWNFPTGVNAPTINGLEVSTKQYVDTVVQGLRPKGAVKVLSDINLAITGVPANVDGVTTLVDGDLILLTNQTDPIENGIWIIHATAWERPANYATGSSAAASYVFIEQGTSHGDTGWNCTTDSPNDIVDTDEIIWQQFNGAGNIIAGNGLGKTGNTIYINPSTLLLGGNAAIDGDQVGIDVAFDNITPNTTPVQVSDPKHLGAILKGIDDYVGGIGQTAVFQFTISGTDITNKYKDLPHTPKTAVRVQVVIKGAGALYYGDDYQMDGTVTNRLTWAGLGMDGIIRSGDKISVYYDV